MAPNTTEPVLPQAPATAVPPSSQSQPPSQQGTQHPVASLDREQLMQLLQHIPGMMNKLVGSDGNLKADAAQTLSNLSQQQPGFPPPVGAQLPAGVTLPHGLVPPPPSGQFPPGFPGEPGPNSHPRGPPNLGQLSAAVAMQAAPPPPPPSGQQQPAGGGTKPPEDDDGDLSDGKGKSDGSPTSTPAPGSAGRRGGRNGAAMGSDEWARMRKDNHKEVERRRRSNINEGINELGRIVPNGSGEKSKGAILSRAVQYIHHLKENEARNIEKWTLEKLLMDQAMGDLQAQLEEVRNMWTEERNGRQRVEAELEALKSGGSASGAASGAPDIKPNGNKRPSEEGEQGKEDDIKRQRME
ncbi:hypothetical protein E1B28_013676 [Marasmius oreades]|uniref:BHLH domain-containing protein n=1 Tax=Marasmius oreades TaxID=181124 RepID=A0A9P7RR23_9AGAR|nr:uncharacterized protein E1B28_013676 [Marasmius oreades]KAG7087730.1 hypothetical protein E1B28_013676 [Marasmius oreades]